MNPFILTALRFALPSLKLLFSQLALTGTQAWLADVVLKLIDQALGVATSGGRGRFSSSAVAGVSLPPESEMTEEGIAAWVEENAPGSDPDDAA